MIGDGRKLAIEIEQEEIAHEVVAGRERGETAFQQCIERALVIERACLAVGADERESARTQFFALPLGAVDDDQAVVEIGCIEGEAEVAAIGLEPAGEMAAE